MAVYLVGYDLHEGEDYEPLITFIKKLSNGNWWHCLDSTWLIVHGGNSSAIRDAIIPYLPRKRDDQLLVAVMGKSDAAWIGFNQACSDWLKENM